MKVYGLAAVDRFLEKYSENIVDVITGSLVDSVILNIGKRYILLKEHYLNSWSSGNTFHNFNSLEKCYKKLGTTLADRGKFSDEQEGA